MIKRSLTILAIAGAAILLPSTAAGAAQDLDSKKAFQVVCTSGTLAGQTLTVVSSKTVFHGTNELRLTGLRTEFDGKVKDKQFGNTQGTLTCGGTEVTPGGTFTFFATLLDV